MSNQAAQAADAATTGSNVGSTAAQETRAVASTAMDDAKQVADQAREQTSRVASEVSSQARSALERARDDVRSQADLQTERIAESLRSLAGQVQALLDGRTKDAGQLPDLARQASEQLQSFASRLSDGGVDGMLDQTRRFARRRPGVFLAGAVAAGFASGRLFRGVKAASAQPVTPTDARGNPPLGGATTLETDVIELTEPPTDAPPGALTGVEGSR